MNPDHVLVVIMSAVLVLGFDGFCLVNLTRAKGVRFLPKWLWAVITLMSFPLGGILYLTVGRDWGRDWGG